MIQKIKEFLCRKFGHDFNSVDMCFFRIQMDSIRLGDKVKPSIKCQRCNREWKYNSKGKLISEKIRKV